MFPSCSHCFTSLRTYFVFSVAQLLPMLVNFFGFNGNFNGKMTKIKRMAKNHFSGVQNGICFNIPHWPSSYLTDGRLQHIKELVRLGACDPHLDQTKFNDLLPLTIDGVLKGKYRKVNKRILCTNISPLI